MPKFSAQKDSPRLRQVEAGVINPLVIGGVVVAGIIVFLIASGSLKFSGYIKNDTNKPDDVENSVTETKPAPQLTEEPKTEVKLNPEAFSDAKLGFSISYPEGWKVKSATSNVTVYKPSSTKGGDQADALVTIVSGAIGELKDTKLASIADLHKVFIKKQFSNVEFTGEKDVSVNGQEGYRLEFTGTVNDENMRAKYIVLKGEKNLFALVAVANIGMWNDLEKELDASVQTFKIQ